MPPTETVVAEPETTVVEAEPETTRAVTGAETEPVAHPEPTAPAAPEPAAPAPEAAFVRKVFEMNREVSHCEDDYLAKKEAASSARKRLEAAQAMLNAFIRRNDAPLFDGAERRDEAEPVVTPDPAPAPEAWREVTVMVLGADHGLSAAAVDRLMQAGLDTIGRVADWTSGGKSLTDVPGVGPAKADQIEAALSRFWAARQAAGPERPADPDDSRPDDIDRAPLSGPINDALIAYTDAAEAAKAGPDSAGGVIEGSLERLLEAESDADADAADAGPDLERSGQRRERFDALPVASPVLGLEPAWLDALAGQEVATAEELGDFIESCGPGEVDATLRLDHESAVALCDAYYRAMDLCCGDPVPPWMGDAPRCAHCEVKGWYSEAGGPSRFDPEPKAKWCCPKCSRVLATVEPPRAEAEPGPFVPDHADIEAAVAGEEPGPRRRRKAKAEARPS